MITDVSNMYSPSTATYTVLYDGLSVETTVTNEAKTVDQWISSIYPTIQGVVGLDTEWMQVEKRNKVAILQLCIENKCLIIQLFCINSIPRSLQDFFMDLSFEFVGVGVMNDISMLEKNYGLECNKGKGKELFDLASDKWPGRICSRSLKDLAKKVVDLDMEKSKAICTSDWKSKQLTQKQVEYASIDAYVSFKIGKIIIS